MTPTIKTITAGSNCFLVKADSGFVLIDTGVASSRTAVDKELTSVGCGASDLKLIVLTHGDSDHADNSAYHHRHGPGHHDCGQYPGVAWHGVPDENVLCLLMSSEMPTGEVVHHPAFLAGT